MNCHECQERLEQHALGADSNEDPTYKTVSAHLRSCSECQTKLAELTETWALIGESIDPVAPSQHLESRVLGQIDVAPRSPESDRSVATNMGRFTPYLVATAVLVLATTGIYFVRYRPDAQAQTKVEKLTEQIRDLENFKKGIGNPKVVYVALTDIDRPNTLACLILDSVTNEIHFFAPNLPRLSDGDEYKLWLLSTGKVVASAALELNENRVGSTVVEVGRSHDIDAAQITVESDPAASRPTGRLHLRTKIDLPGPATER